MTTTILARDQIETFWRGPHSNWHMRKFVVNDVGYNCVEQWMMACKARLFGDLKTLERIMLATSPKDQKALGREVAGYIDAVWQAVNEDLVFVGALAKYTQHADLFDLLVRTKDLVLIEASPYDRIWGAGLSAEDDRILNPSLWPGLNKQGKMLTRVRTVLQTCVQHAQR